MERTTETQRIKVCNTCRHCGVLRNNDSSLVKVCRRNPPVVHAIMRPAAGGAVSHGTLTAWPWVGEGDWCGEYTAALDG